MATPWRYIHPQDTVIVQKNGELASHQLAVMIDLYLPIIGPVALTLYQKLFAKKQLLISELLNVLDVGLADFYTARSHLEALGLLRIYKNEVQAHEFLYQVLPPLKVKAFFEDEMLRALLLDQVGETALRKLYEKYTAPQVPKGYREVTQAFQDVFHFNPEKIKRLQAIDTRPLSVDSVQHRDRDVLEQARATFDFKFYMEGLDKHFVKKSSITEDIQKIIATYHLLYGLDELEMNQLTLSSADVETGAVSSKKLTHEILRYLEQRQPKQETSATSQTPEETIPLTGALKKLVRHAEATPPGNYLKSLKDQKNGFVSSDEKWILKELMESSGLSSGAINILLNYILNIRQETTLNKAYTLKIANDWAQHQVQTATDAVQKLQTMAKEQPQNKQQKKRHSRNYRTQKRQTETLPDWWGKEAATQADKQPQEGIDRDLLERLKKIRHDKAKGADDS